MYVYMYIFVFVRESAMPVEARESVGLTVIGVTVNVNHLFWVLETELSTKCS